MSFNLKISPKLHINQLKTIMETNSMGAKNVKQNHKTMKAIS